MADASPSPQGSNVGNTAADLVFSTQAPFEQIIVDRPLDVSLVITTMLARSADSGDEFAGRIDPARIGVLGHSFGGYTSLAVAGGFGIVPRDPRVRAMAPLAPASGILSDTDLAAIGIPTLFVSGTLDITTPIDPNTVRPWELLSSPWRFRADIIDAGHQSFSNICDFTAALDAAGVPPDLTAFILGAADEGCGPDLIDIDEAHRLTRIYVNAFMKTFVAGEPAYRQVLNRRYAIMQGDAIDFRQFNPGPLRPSPYRR